MWTEINRWKYEREGQRYASDLRDAEWALIEPHRHIVTDTCGLLVGAEVHRAVPKIAMVPCWSLGH